MSAVHVAEREEAHEVRPCDASLIGSAFDLLATSPQGVEKLRELILLRAMQGRLAKQDPRDKSADHLIERIRAKKDRLIANGEIKRGKPLADIDEEDAPYKLPESWRWARMGDVASYIQRGKGPSYAEKSNFRVISQKCVRWHGLDIGPARCITQESLAKYESVRFLQPGDLLWNSTGTGTIGRACLFPDEYTGAEIVADSHVTVVRPLEVDAHFLWLWVRSPYVQSQIEEKASGTTNQIELNTSTVKNQLVPLPPLAEQVRIVARVEELMQLCDALEAHGRLQDEQHARLVATLFDALAASESAEELAENWQRIAAHFDLLLDRPEAVDALERSILQLAVRGLLVPQDETDEPAVDLLARIHSEGERLKQAGEIKRKRSKAVVGSDERPFELPSSWEWVAFDDLVRPDKPIAYGVLVPGPDQPDGVPFVRLADISLIDPPTKPAKHISPDVDAQFERTRLEGGEILLGVVGSIGKLGVAPTSWRGANIARAICRIFPTDLIDKKYVIYLLQSDLMQRRFKGDTRTLAQPTLNVGLIRSCPVPLPPIAEQQRIAARVEQLCGFCAELRERLEQASVTQSRLADALVSEAVQNGGTVSIEVTH